MRHARTINHLGRTNTHRDAMLSNMACSLIKHKRISTTVAKAKALRKFIEPLITKSKVANKAVVTPVVRKMTIAHKDGTTAEIERKIRVNSTTAVRRTVFRYLKDNEAVKELFGEIAPKVADRPGGYTRILKTGFRAGDTADTCIIELVDYNENMLTAKKDAKSKTTTRRSRRSSAKKTEVTPATAGSENATAATPAVTNDGAESVAQPSSTDDASAEKE
jgi:large subunit ribosomal protein L17